MKMKLNFIIAFISMFVTVGIVNATQFESVIDAMVIKSSDNYTNNGWEDISKIKGVTWKCTYYKSESHNSTMIEITRVGKNNNPNIGATEISVNGSRTMITSVQISIITNEDVDLEIFGKGTITNITTSCDEFFASYSVHFYKFEKIGYKPLYISYQMSVGASEDGNIDFEIAYRLDDVFSNFHPCEILK